MIATRQRLLITLPLALAASLAQPPPDSPALTFQTQTRLVLLSFHAIQGKSYVPGLQASDVVLLEDGKPRNFSIFDSPDTQGRMPLEIVLLFDAHHAIPYFWDPAGVYRFVHQWDEAMSREILESKSADIRISIYDTRSRRLFRRCQSTTDPRQVVDAFDRLLQPELLTPNPGPGAIALELPPQRASVGPGPFTNDYVTSYFISNESRGWPMEAAIGTLNDVAAAAGKVARVLVIFSEGIGATTTVPPDVGEHALDLGIPIYPVVTNFQRHIQANYPRNLFRMQQFASLGTMTGGYSVEYPEIDAASLRKILDGVRNDGLSQYLVGFAPSSSASPKEHTLEIKLKSKSSGALTGGRRRAIY
jgi:hypothetical protein